MSNTVGDRPLNSALEVDLDFDRNTVPAPAPTEEATVDLETLIMYAVHAVHAVYTVCIHQASDGLMF